MARDGMDFRIPVPTGCRDAGKGKGNVALWVYVILMLAMAWPSAADKAISGVCFSDAAGCRESSKALVQGGGADAAAVAQFGEWHGAVDVGKYGGDALVERARTRRDRLGRFDGLQCEGGPALREGDGDGRERRRGAMLDGQRQVIAIAAQIEV